MKRLKTGPAVRGSVQMSAVFLLALAMTGCGGSTEPRPADGPAVQGLRVEAVRPQNVAAEIAAPGSVVAESTAQVAARTMGTVTQVVVREGDLVKRGQLLAQLDERELVARRNAARAALEGAAAGVAEANRGVTAAQAQADVARKTYDRYVYLRDQKSVSPQEFDEVEAKQRAAQAGFDQTKARLEQAQTGKARAESEARAAEEVAGYARVVAPFDGRVVRRTVEPGSLIAPGVPLFTVEDTSHYQLEVTLPGDAITAAAASSGSIRRGSIARVELDAMAGQAFLGKVIELEAGADPLSHTVRARIELPRNPAMQSGLFGRAWFRRGERRVLAVAASAVIERGQLRGIYVTDLSGTARWKVVTPGPKIGDQVEILSGLSEGEQVVVNPGNRELDGAKVAAAAGGGQEKSR